MQWISPKIFLGKNNLKIELRWPFFSILLSPIFKLGLLATQNFKNSERETMPEHIQQGYLLVCWCSFPKDNITANALQKLSHFFMKPVMQESLDQAFCGAGLLTLQGRVSHVCYLKLVIQPLVSGSLPLSWRCIHRDAQLYEPNPVS